MGVCDVIALIFAIVIIIVAFILTGFGNLISSVLGDSISDYFTMISVLLTSNSNWPSQNPIVIPHIFTLILV
jgi:uncharacterized membrane protein